MHCQSCAGLSAEPVTQWSRTRSDSAFLNICEASAQHWTFDSSSTGRRNSDLLGFQICHRWNQTIQLPGFYLSYYGGRITGGHFHQPSKLLPCRVAESTAAFSERLNHRHHHHFPFPSRAKKVWPFICHMENEMWQRLMDPASTFKSAWVTQATCCTPSSHTGACRLADDPQPSESDIHFFFFFLQIGLP